MPQNVMSQNVTSQFVVSQPETPLEQARRHIREGATRLERQKALVDRLQHRQLDGMLLRAHEVYLEMLSTQMLAHEHYVRLAEKMLSVR